MENGDALRMENGMENGDALRNQLSSLVLHIYFPIILVLPVIVATMREMWQAFFALTGESHDPYSTLATVGRVRVLPPHGPRALLENRKYS
jgi:hypothetical protein